MAKTDLGAAVAKARQALAEAQDKYGKAADADKPGLLIAVTDAGQALLDAQAAQIAAQSAQAADTPADSDAAATDETTPGGRYKVGGRFVDADGKALDG